MKEKKMLDDRWLCIRYILAKSKEIISIEKFGYTKILIDRDDNTWQYYFQKCFDKTWW